MFSSNPFAGFTSSFHAFPPPLFAADHEHKDNAGIHLNHHQDPFSQVAGTTSQGLMIKGVQTHFDHQCSPPTLESKKRKTDRHSKIVTAQGSRVRRVRLSIEIARKFFNLHDMLGFDKASKTLDWLLEKSKSAITELAETKSLSSTASYYELDHQLVEDHSIINAEQGPDGDGVLVPKNKCLGKEKKRKETLTYRSRPDRLIARKSRAEARARARERTREKMQIKKLDELKNLIDFPPLPGLNHHPSFTNYYWTTSHDQFEDRHELGENLNSLESSSTVCSYHRLSLAKHDLNCSSRTTGSWT